MIIRNYLIKKHCQNNNLFQFIEKIEETRFQSIYFKPFQKMRNYFNGLKKTAIECLFISIEKEFLDITEYLMKNGIAPYKFNTRNQKKFNQLILNISPSSQIKLITFMLNNGIFFSTKDLIEQAIMTHQNEIVKTLIQNNCIAYLEYLHIAKKHHNSDLIEYFRFNSIYQDFDRIYQLI